MRVTCIMIVAFNISVYRVHPFYPVRFRYMSVRLTSVLFGTFSFIVHCIPVCAHYAFFTRRLVGQYINEQTMDKNIFNDQLLFSPVRAIRYSVAQL